MRLYYNPRCSKSRAALELLEAAGHAPEVFDYQATPPTRADLEALLDALADAPRTLLRDAGTSEAPGAAEVIDRLLTDPSVMQRPVLVHAGRAVVARPPERVFELVDPAQSKPSPS